MSGIESCTVDRYELVLFIADLVGDVTALLRGDVRIESLVLGVESRRSFALIRDECSLVGDTPFLRGDDVGLCRVLGDSILSLSSDASVVGIAEEVRAIRSLAGEMIRARFF